MSNSGRAIWTFLCIGIAALALAPTAAAEVTSSQITSPSSPTFAIADEDAPPSTIAVSGTTDSTAPGTDKVDLDCFYGAYPTHATLETEVELEPDGSFTVPAAALSEIRDMACRLRAVPAGAPPLDPTPFEGPVMAIGERDTGSISSGPNAGTITDYYIWGQQLTAANEYESAGSCGLAAAYLFDSSFENTATTFDCNDYWYSSNAYPYPTGTRSEILVDGANAYLPVNAGAINPEAAGLPPLTYSYSQNPLNGDLTIHESDPIVGCPSAEYPPSPESCPSFESTGVRDDRTIKQTDDGHLVTIADRFVSTDGDAHSLNLLPENDQEFGGNGEQIAYRFPGETSYSTHEAGDDVPFSGDTPGAVFIEVEGSEDGDQSTGRGAIVFDHRAAPAHFKYVAPNVSELYFHQTAEVPADGSTTIRFAYASAYTQAEVDALAKQAEEAFAPVPLTPVVSRPAAVLPDNMFQIRRIQRIRRNGTAKLFVWVPGPGSLVLFGRTVRKARRRPGAAGVVVVRVAPKRKFAKRLRRRGHLRIGFRIAFTPTGGKARTVHRVLRLAERRHRRHGG